MKIIRIVLLALVAAFVTSIAAQAADPTGRWKFTAEGPGGRSVESTLTLKWDGDRLTGAIDNRAGKADISKATFADDQVSFTVVREIGRKLRKQTFAVVYRGKVEGDTIRGTLETVDRNKKAVSIPWEAQRVK